MASASKRTSNRSDWSLEAVRMYWEGAPPSRIAQAFGKSRRAVWEALNRAGGPLPKPGHMRPRTDLDKIAAAIEDGWPQNEIEKTFHISHHTIKRYFPDVKWDGAPGLGKMNGLLARL